MALVVVSVGSTPRSLIRKNFPSALMRNGASVWSRRNSVSCQSLSIMARHMPRASAPSVPGCTATKSSAFCAMVR